MYCDVASGFNFQIGHFLIYIVWKEKKSLSAMEYDSEYNEEGLAHLCSTISAEPIGAGSRVPGGAQAPAGLFLAPPDNRKNYARSAT